VTKVWVRTMPGGDGGWQNVTDGAEPHVVTFTTLTEARAAGRARAKRLRCAHIVYDVDGAPVAATIFGGSNRGKG
jgi:hypothetical protein